MDAITRQQDGKYNMPMRSQIDMKAMVWWISYLNARKQATLEANLL